MEVFSETFVHSLNSVFLGLQTKDKASVKWDLAVTWEELAEAVSDIIWKRRLRCMNREVINGAGGGQRAVRCVRCCKCLCVTVCA